MTRQSYLSLLYLLLITPLLLLNKNAPRLQGGCVEAANAPWLYGLRVVGDIYPFLYGLRVVADTAPRR